MSGDRARNETCHSTCLICNSPRLRSRFRVAFPEMGPGFTHAWPLTVEPPVPSWTITGCEDCGVHFPNPFPAKEVIADFYTCQLQPNEWEQQVYVNETHDWSDVADRLTRLCGGPGEMREIGPAAGHLMKAMRDRRWSVFGVEATPKFATILKERGLPAHQGILETFPHNRRYDLVAMFDVLEHLHDPIADLRRCVERLKPGGKLVISTCDIGSFAARYYGLRWRQLVISHTFYWTRRSLEIALRKASLEATDFSSIRWWDPDPVRERRAWVREFGKLAVRKGIQLTWTPLATRSPRVQRFQHAQPTLDRWLSFNIGDQAVMSEVVLAVATLV